jgi:hypothetical protein
MRGLDPVSLSAPVLSPLGRMGKRYGFPLEKLRSDSLRFVAEQFQQTGESSVIGRVQRVKGKP